jgi:hypothetical protein
MLKIIKRVIIGIIDFVVRLSAPILAPFFYWVARSGTGSDACLRLGFLPMRVDYYSPVPDIHDLEQRNVWDRRSELAGIDFRPEAQVSFLTKLGREFGHECDWPPNSTGEPYQFFTENNTFSYGCAASLHCIIRKFRPRRVIEIGSGNSSLVISAALSLNTQSSISETTDYTIIDPYPRPIIEKGLPGLTHLIKKRVESLDIGFFDRLRENDVLFIDSGHTVRIGSDVNSLILDVLPRLAQGVLVHFHDIGLPHEYPKIYATNPHFRVFWTEAYLLQAFLCFNEDFEILLAMAYLMSERVEAFRAAFPLYDPEKYMAMSASFWIRRILTSEV